MPDTEQRLIQSFITAVWKNYRENPRPPMPWRENHEPYRVLLSEMMLQQTQVSRVVNYFNTFVARWKTITELSRASLEEVLQAWSGLGYYRRAKYLHECAREVAENHGGVIPDNKRGLLTLRGIGEYTASAILAFAYDKPVAVLETNIRRAIIHHFFSGQDSVTDTQVYAYVEQTVDANNPREWYWALMDYGAALAFKVINPNRRSTGYVKQSAFEGSNRQVRAAILRVLLRGGVLRFKQLERAAVKELSGRRDTPATLKEKIYANIEQLEKEHFMVCENGVYSVSSESGSSSGDACIL